MKEFPIVETMKLSEADEGEGGSKRRRRASSEQASFLSRRCERKTVINVAFLDPRAKVLAHTSVGATPDSKFGFLGKSYKNRDYDHATICQKFLPCMLKREQLG